MADRWRLAFIRRARRLGFTLGEIGEAAVIRCACRARALAWPARPDSRPRISAASPFACSNLRLQRDI